MIEVRLAQYEVAAAALVGVSRQTQSLFAGGRRTVENPWEKHVEGACAEMAFAKATGNYWSHSVGTFKSVGDVGDVEVRLSRIGVGGLRVYDRDELSRAFVLVVGCAPVFRIVGWRYGFEVQSIGRRWTNGYLCGFEIGQDKLEPIELLTKATR